jgi:pimeloyl-ACP methyl ester carboxylesterase
MIPLSRRAPWIAATAFGITRRMKPERLKAQLVKSVPEPDRAILAPLPAPVAVGYSVAAFELGVHGTVDDYRAFGGAWGFDLDDVAAPVRCWQGADDTLLPMTHARRLVDSLPTGTLEEVPAAGHFLWITHTDEVCGRLLEDARV